MAGGHRGKTDAADINLSGMTLVIIWPDIHVDTPWAFQAWDESNGSPDQEEALTTTGLDNKNPSPVSPPVTVNDFEPVVFREVSDYSAKQRKSL